MDVNSFVIGYTKGKQSAGGGGSMEGFHMVQFFNDDRTTLLYTVFVPTGASAMYAGETPASTVNNMFVFEGFQPAATNVTADMDCFAVYSEQVKSLDQTSWAKISELSADGTAQNFFAVGDTKMIRVIGTVGTIEVDKYYLVYIIGFDHNEELEGNGITFGTFKDSSGKDVCLHAPKSSGGNVDGFTMNHWGNSNNGGWAGSDMRYDILGSTDTPPSGYGASPQTGRTGSNPSATCATSPVANTLMSALPADLRAVMKPMTIYSDNTGGGSGTAKFVTASIDYLPVLAEFEVWGSKEDANSNEQTYQKRYAYYTAGKSKVKYKHSSPESATTWWLRSVSGLSGTAFCGIGGNGLQATFGASNSLGLAPIFKV